jgi:hypothetical protein
MIVVLGNNGKVVIDIEKGYYENVVIALSVMALFLKLLYHAFVNLLIPMLPM